MDIVFFDASVLFKAAVTRFLLGAAVEGEFRPAWSEAVIDEVRRNLDEAGRSFARAAFEQNIEYIRDPAVSKAGRRAAASLVATHPKDRHVLAAAIAAKAATLVTSNPRDFDPTEATRRRVGIATPDDFAKSIADGNPYALVRHVERTPPERLARYIELLRAELPVTMEVVEPLLTE